jgi:hypothetical protein
MKNEELYVQAVKQCVSDYTLRWAKHTHQTTDKEFAHNGSSTIAIARELGVPCGFIRPQLDKLAKKGLLIKGSCEVFCMWWPVGYLAEIKKLNVEQEHAECAIND